MPRHDKHTSLALTPSIALNRLLLTFNSPLLDSCSVNDIHLYNFSSSYERLSSASSVLSVDTIPHKKAVYYCKNIWAKSDVSYNAADVGNRSCCECCDSGVEVDRLLRIRKRKRRESGWDDRNRSRTFRSDEVRMERLSDGGVFERRDSR